MVNSKQKPAPEGPKRSPGKSRFSMPKREAPPVDGSYLDRLFADYERQTKGPESQTESISPTAEIVPPSSSVATPSQVEASEPANLSQTTEFVDDSSRPSTSLQAAQPSSEEISSTINVASVSAPPPITTMEEASTAPPLTVQEEDRATPQPVAISIDDLVLLDRLKKKHRLGKGEVNVLKEMIRLCRGEGVDYCYIKIPQLMVAANLKERQTQLVLRSLRDLELIEKLAEYSNIDRLGTKYRVNFSSF